MLTETKNESSVVQPFDEQSEEVLAGRIEEVCTPIPVAPHVNSDEGSAEQETDLEQEHAPKEDCRAPEEFFQKTLNQKYCHSMK